MFNLPADSGLYSGSALHILSRPSHSSLTLPPFHLSKWRDGNLWLVPFEWISGDCWSLADSLVLLSAVLLVKLLLVLTFLKCRCLSVTLDVLKEPVIVCISLTTALTLFNSLSLSCLTLNYTFPQQPILTEWRLWIAWSCEWDCELLL